MDFKSPRGSSKKTTKKTQPEASSSPASLKASKPQKVVESKSAAGPSPKEIGEHPLINMMQVFRAVRALKTHTANLLDMPGAKTQLFAAEHPITVEILLHKVPIEGSLKRKLIPLAKPIRNPDTTEICVFVRDSAVAKPKLSLAAAPNIKKVIDIKKLRTHYSQYEAKRTLAKSYDLFLCEDSVLGAVCKLLGTSFLRIRKAPVAFKLTTGAADAVAKVRDSTLFDLSPGVTQSYKIGDTGFTEAELCQNFVSSIDRVVAQLPLKWPNVKQIAIIATGSAPLPVYNNLTPPSTSGAKADHGPTKSNTPSNGKAKTNGEVKTKSAETKTTTKSTEGKEKRPAPEEIDESAKPSPKRAKMSESSTPSKTYGKKIAETKKTPETPSTPKASAQKKESHAASPQPRSASTTPKKTSEAKITATSPKLSTKNLEGKTKTPSKRTPEKVSSSTPKSFTTSSTPKISSKPSTPNTRSGTKSPGSSKKK